MKVMVAEKCGFCPGVRNAISTAERILAATPPNEQVYSLGPIIHNEDVVERLADSGLRTVGSAEQIDSGTVLIRSHGVSPRELERLHEKGLRIVDATCVLVKRVQQIAKQLEEEGYEVVIIGEENHPEVQGVMLCPARCGRCRRGGPGQIAIGKASRDRVPDHPEPGALRPDAGGHRAGQFP